MPDNANRISLAFGLDLSILPVSSTAQPDLDFHSFLEAKGAADNA